VSTYSASCACVPATSTGVIPPGATAPLTFRVDLHATRCARAESQAVREVKIQVALGRDASPPAKPIVVELRGRVKSAIVVPARSIDFGRFPATATAKPRVIPIRSLVGLRELAVSAEGLSVAVDLKQLAIDKWELHVQPATAAVGRHETKVKLTPTTSADEKASPITVPVVFDVLHDIQPDTSLVPLGYGRVGETLSGTLTIVSLSGRPFARPTCDVKEVSVQTATATAPQVSHTFRFERTVAATGNQTAPVIVRGSDADGQSFELRVEVQWYGLAP
jgi:hypothetical protein